MLVYLHLSLLKYHKIIKAVVFLQTMRHYLEKIKKAREWQEGCRSFYRWRETKTQSDVTASPVTRDTQPDGGGHGRQDAPACLCCPLRGQTCMNTAACVHPLSRDQPSTPMSGDEGEAHSGEQEGRIEEEWGDTDSGGAEREGDQPEPESISQTQSSFHQSAHTHTHMHTTRWLGLLPNVHLCLPSPLHQYKWCVHSGFFHAQSSSAFHVKTFQQPSPLNDETLLYISPWYYCFFTFFTTVQSSKKGKKKSAAAA